jgi:glycosyltransferase involved in cell wall biosynthesis
VVDPLSVDSIRAGLEAMLTDDALHARLAAAAIPQASKFSWERAARETLAVFEEAIAVRKEKIRLGLV